MMPEPLRRLGRERQKRNDKRTPKSRSPDAASIASEVSLGLRISCFLSHSCFVITEHPMPAQAKDTLQQLLEALGFDATIEEHSLEDGLMLDVKTEDSGRLIGRQGQTLSDLQYLLNRLLFQQDQTAPKVMVDVGGYRSQA